MSPCQAQELSSCSPFQPHKKKRSRVGHFFLRRTEDARKASSNFRADARVEQPHRFRKALVYSTGYSMACLWQVQSNPGSVEGKRERADLRTVAATSPVSPETHK